MRPNEPIEKRIADLKAKPSAQLDARVHRAIDEALAERKQKEPAGFLLPNTWRMIMKTPMTRWTAAGVAVAALVAGLLVFDKAAPSAFGLDQVIAASKGVRFLHIKMHTVKDQEPIEFWIASDESGHVAKIRNYQPVTEDGAKLITWTPERTEVWFQTKHGFLTLHDDKLVKGMQDLLEQSQPQLATEKLKEDEKAGKVDLDIQQPADKELPIKIVVTGKKTTGFKRIYLIDQKTDLISSIETYATRKGEEVLLSKMEFLEYNVPIDDKMFSLRDQLPADVSISDQATQVSGVAQGNLSDEQAAAQTAREFFQALIDKDYKKAGLVIGGQLEQYTKTEYGQLNVTAIVSVGPAILQTNWMKRGYMVPCEVEITHPDGQKSIWKSTPYVRPGDDQRHPDHWNITGGISAAQADLKILPDNKKYEQMTPKQAAEAFFRACAKKDWDEMAKFWPEAPTGEKFDRMKESLGGLELVSVGEPFQKSPYPGWYVPYEIKLPPTEINVRVSNTNSARRYVIYGLYDAKLQPMEKLEWNNEPETLAKEDAYGRMSPAEVAKAYFDSMTRSDWAAMGKVAPASDVEQTKHQYAEMKKAGMDPRDAIPTVDVGEAVWSPAESAFFVKCRMAGVKKFNLAVRNDNPANRYLFDGGL
jgi:ketosteroid isomerase-like protein